MNDNVKIIYKKIQGELKQKGYINLNHRLVNTKEDLVELATIFRDPRYETFRIIYMNGNSIVGNESITTRTPDSVIIGKLEKNGKINSEKCYYKMNERIERLNADGYYLIHNHPSGSAIASKTDIRTTELISQMVKGFKGHLIINTDSYAWIDIDKNKIADVENYIPINQNKAKKMEKELQRKNLYDVKINSRTDLVSIMCNIKNSPNYSIAILTDAGGKVRMILDVPNRMLNQNESQLNGYFKNLARINGVTKILFATNNENVYEKACKHLEYGTLKDLICYQDDGKNKIYISKASEYFNQCNLFELTNNKKSLLDSALADHTKHYQIKENNNDYEFKMTDGFYISDEYDPDFDEYVPQELPPVEKGYLRVLHKKVGYPPKIKIIEDTLESKQKLVDGLIEVIPFIDESGVLIICNEDGKLMNKSPNILLDDYDYVAGDLLLIGDDYKNSDFKSLTRDEIIRCRDDLMKSNFKYLNYEEILERNKKSKNIEKDMEN